MGLAISKTIKADGTRDMLRAVEARGLDLDEWHYWRGSEAAAVRALLSVNNIRDLDFSDTVPSIVTVKDAQGQADAAQLNLVYRRGQARGRLRQKAEDFLNRKYDESERGVLPLFVTSTAATGPQKAEVRGYANWVLDVYTALNTAITAVNQSQTPGAVSLDLSAVIASDPKTRIRDVLAL